jgi:hypothetical protein
MPAMSIRPLNKPKADLFPANGSVSLSDGTTPSDHGLAVLSFKTRDEKGVSRTFPKQKELHGGVFADGIERRKTT